jgi:hypothetical protein
MTVFSPSFTGIGGTIPGLVDGIPYAPLHPFEQHDSHQQSQEI